MLFVPEKIIELFSQNRLNSVIVRLYYYTLYRGRAGRPKNQYGIGNPVLESQYTLQTVSHTEIGVVENPYWYDHMVHRIKDV